MHRQIDNNSLIKVSKVRTTFYSLLLPIFLSVHSRYGKCVTILFHSQKKINYYFAFTQHLISPHVCTIATKMAAEAKVPLKLLDVIEDFNDTVDMNGSI